jgi:quercetin dioxygenase-like cupin family protein
MDERSARNIAPVVALDRLAVTGDGVAWSVSPGGVHANLVVLGPGGAIGAHRNDEMDVLFVCVAGSGELGLDGGALGVSACEAVLVPHGVERSVTAGGDGLRYLTIHAERPPLQIRGRSDV